jgi:prophage tail gpP-like protein
VLIVVGMRISVALYSGKVVTLDVERDETIADVLQKIQDHVGFNLFSFSSNAVHCSLLSI